MNFSETRAEATDNVSVELSEKHPRLFVHDNTFGAHYPLLDHTLCCEESVWVECSIAKLSYLKP